MLIICLFIPLRACYIQVFCLKLPGLLSSWETESWCRKPLVYIIIFLKRAILKPGNVRSHCLFFSSSSQSFCWITVFYFFFFFFGSLNFTFCRWQHSSVVMNLLSMNVLPQISQLWRKSICICEFSVYVDYIFGIISQFVLYSLT